MTAASPKYRRRRASQIGRGLRYGAARGPLFNLARTAALGNGARRTPSATSRARLSRDIGCCQLPFRRMAADSGPWCYPRRMTAVSPFAAGRARRGIGQEGRGAAIQPRSQTSAEFSPVADGWLGAACQLRHRHEGRTADVRDRSQPAAELPRTGPSPRLDAESAGSRKSGRKRLIEAGQR